MTWDDGTLPASDTPWRDTDQLLDFTVDRYGRIFNLGSLISWTGQDLNFSLCGNREWETGLD